MNQSETLNGILKDLGMKEKAERCSVSLTHETATDHTRLVERISSDADATGWVCCTDKVFVIGQGLTADDPVGVAAHVTDIDFPEQQQRHLLYGELITATGSCLRFREGESGWDIFEVTEIEESTKDGGGTECLAFTERFLSRTTGKLVYRTYYRSENVVGVDECRPWLSRLVSIESRSAQKGEQDV